MRTLDAALEAHYNLGRTTTAMLLKLVRNDGTTYGFTSHSENVTISSVTYTAAYGFQASAIKIEAGLAVGNLELFAPDDDSVFTTKDVMNDMWRNAQFTLSRYNYKSPADGVDVRLFGYVGEVRKGRGVIRVELLDLRQLMQQTVSIARSKNCRARLGDDLCGVNLASGSPTTYTVTGTLTGVTSNQVFRDSSRTEPLARFDAGQITFNTGNNTNVSRLVKTYAADGTFTVGVPLFGTVQVGDTYTAIWGCRKRIDDCKDFNNVRRFQGEPHGAGLDSLTRKPVLDV